MTNYVLFPIKCSYSKHSTCDATGATVCHLFACDGGRQDCGGLVKLVKDMSNTVPLSLIDPTLLQWRSGLHTGIGFMRRCLNISSIDKVRTRQ